MELETKDNELYDKLKKLNEQEENKGDRYFARKFKQAYNKIRKSSVLIAKSRKEVGNEEAYNTLKNFIISVFEED